MRDLDCLPTIKSKADHRLTKKTLTTLAADKFRNPASGAIHHASMRASNTAHNGLVAGSSPAEPTNEINPGASAYLNCAGVTRSVVRWNSLFC
jgi:hypothetical protein